MSFNLNHYKEILNDFDSISQAGCVKEVTGNIIKAHNIGMSVGELCALTSTDGNSETLAEVVGFKGDEIYIMPLTTVQGLGPKSKIKKTSTKTTIPLNQDVLGRVFDCVMNPLDGKPKIQSENMWPIYNSSPNPMLRNRIKEPLDVGLKAINGLITVGRGQRMSILAGSGVGKSVLLGMMARHTKADVSVIGLIGERGREVLEFIHRDLGPEGFKKSVVIAATSDQSPLVRVRAAYTATTVAEYFREQGKQVLLLIDSLTRFAMAQREIGLSIGEPPTSKGYPPSVFSKFPQLLERAGNSNSSGSITGFYAVLVEGDDPNDPIGDSVRSIVDGHIILDRQIAAKGYYPAIDILNSKSRLMNDLISKEHLKLALNFNHVLATYKNAEDLINIGAYVKGSNPKIDYAISKIDALQDFLRQEIQDKVSLTEAVNLMRKLVADFKF